MNKKRFTVEIRHPRGDYEPSLGWIYYTFKTENASVTIHVSDVFNSLLSISRAFISLMNEPGPRHDEIDEEGTIKVIDILPEMNDQIRLQIKDYDYGEQDENDPDYPRTYIDVVLDRYETVVEFTTQFIAFLENDFSVERWREGRYGNLGPGLRKMLSAYMDSCKKE